MDSFIVVLAIFTGAYVLAKMANLAEKTKTDAVRREIERQRQHRIDTLYGRDDEKDL